jgi:protein-histidine pros-kinase
MKLPGPLNDNQEKPLRIVQRSARLLLALINDLLDLAKIESGKVNIKLEQVICQEVIEEVAASLRPLAEERGLRFTVATPAEPIAVQADRRALSQILINLINNAIKFTDAGAVRVVLARAADQGRMRTTIRVIDTGIGIAPKDHGRLFQAFERVGSAEVQRREGTGLGLRLSRKLAELLGGQITVESELGRGSTFTLTLLEEHMP